MVLIGYCFQLIEMLICFYMLFASVKENFPSSLPYADKHKVIDLICSCLCSLSARNS